MRLEIILILSSFLFITSGTFWGRRRSYRVNKSSQPTNICEPYQPRYHVCRQSGQKLPNCEDCSSYYQCIQRYGQIRLIQCPSGLQFNFRTRECDSSGCPLSRGAKNTYISDKSRSSSRSYQAFPYRRDKDKSSSNSASYQVFSHRRDQNKPSSSSTTVYRVPKITVHGDKGRVFSGPQDFSAMLKPTTSDPQKKHVTRVNLNSGSDRVKVYYSGPKELDAVQQPYTSDAQNKGSTQTDNGNAYTDPAGYAAVPHHKTPNAQTYVSPVDRSSDYFLDTSLFDSHAGRPGDFIRYNPDIPGRGSQPEKKPLDFPQALQQYAEY